MKKAMRLFAIVVILALMGGCSGYHPDHQVSTQVRITEIPWEDPWTDAGSYVFPGIKKGDFLQGFDLRSFGETSCFWQVRMIALGTTEAPVAEGIVEDGVFYLETPLMEIKKDTPAYRVEVTFDYYSPRPSSASINMIRPYFTREGEPLPYYGSELPGTQFVLEDDQAPEFMNVSWEFTCNGYTKLYIDLDPMFGVGQIEGQWRIQGDMTWEPFFDGSYHDLEHVFSVVTPELTFIEMQIWPEDEEGNRGYMRTIGGKTNGTSFNLYNDLRPPSLLVMSSMEYVEFGSWNYYVACGEGDLLNFVVDLFSENVDYSDFRGYRLSIYFPWSGYYREFSEDQLDGPINIPLIPILQTDEYEHVEITLEAQIMDLDTNDSFKFGITEMDVFEAGTSIPLGLWSGDFPVEGPAFSG